MYTVFPPTEYVAAFVRLPRTQQSYRFWLHLDHSLNLTRLRRRRYLLSALGSGRARARRWSLLTDLRRCLPMVVFMPVGICFFVCYTRPGWTVDEDTARESSMCSCHEQNCAVERRRIQHATRGFDIERYQSYNKSNLSRICTGTLHVFQRLSIVDAVTPRI